MENVNYIQQLTIWALPVLFAITFHEVAHGWVASRCGDKTALMLGRLSLNPLNHIDLIGTVIVPTVLLLLGGFLFGWAKPVPVSWKNLKKPRRDMALVALAGPAANLLMIIFWAGIAKISTLINFSASAGSALFMMGMAGININLLLMIFNLIPLPPLDGSRVVTSLLTNKLAWQYNRLESYGFIILMVLIFTGVLNYILKPTMEILGGLVLGVFGLPN